MRILQEIYIKDNFYEEKELSRALQCIFYASYRITLHTILQNFTDKPSRLT